MSRFLNLAVFLTRHYTLLPPSFLECPLTLALVRKQSAFLSGGLIRLPMREMLVSDFLEKKIKELGPIFATHPFVDETQIKGLHDFLGNMCDARIYRATKIGDTVAQTWLGILDEDNQWQEAVRGVPSRQVDSLLYIPKGLRDDGLAVVWGNIQSRLPDTLMPTARTYEASLYRMYTDTYLEEFGAVLLTSLPGFNEVPSKLQYDYNAIKLALEPTCVFEYLLNASPSDIVLLRQTKGFVYFTDTWASACNDNNTLTRIQRMCAQSSKDMYESAKLLNERHALFKQRTIESALKRVESLENALYLAANKLESSSAIINGSSGYTLNLFNQSFETQGYAKTSVEGAIVNSVAVHLTNLSNTERDLIDSCLKCVEMYSDYCNNVTGKMLFDAVLLWSIRFLHNRLEVNQGTTKRVSYLFENANESLPSESELQLDFFEFAYGLFAGTQIEVSNIGGGRADLLFTYQGERLVTEVKREIDDCSFPALAEAYAAQATDYQNVSIRLGFLMVLDLTEIRNEGAPHIRTLIKVEEVLRKGEKDPRIVVIMKVPGRRMRPSDLTKNATRKKRCRKG